MPLQDKKTVYFVSKALTEAQWGYVALEMGLLDWKSLEAILSKSIKEATPRLQRILIRTFPYHFIFLIYIRIDQPPYRLLVPFRWSKGHY